MHLKVLRSRASGHRWWRPRRRPAFVGWPRAIAAVSIRCWPTFAEVAASVYDGSSSAIDGFTHLICSRRARPDASRCSRRRPWGRRSIRSATGYAPSRRWRVSRRASPPRRPLAPRCSPRTRCFGRPRAMALRSPSGCSRTRRMTPPRSCSATPRRGRSRPSRPAQPRSSKPTRRSSPWRARTS